MIITPYCFAQLPGETYRKIDQPLLVKSYLGMRQNALNVAREQGWIIRKNCSNGRVMELQTIDPTGHPIYFITHNATAAQSTRTNSVYSGGALGLTLSGNSAYLDGKLGLWDGGKVLASHQEFSGGSGARITAMDQSSTLSDHATHLAGTLIARGANAQAKGMAFGATLRVWDFADDMAEVGTAAPDLLLSNHAYGPVAGWVFNPDRPGNDSDLKWEWWGNSVIDQNEDYQFGFYTTRASDLDRILFSNPYYLMVRSADNKHNETGPPSGTLYYLRNTNDKSALPRSRNDGYDVIAGDANAKNVLTIGSSEVTLQNSQPIGSKVAAYSGWGPTDDGRIKPDLLGVGTRLFSALSSGNAVYGTNSGTSMASANVTGSLLLLQELYARLNNNAREDSRFMRSATLKALAIHTADRANASGVMQTGLGPDYRQGWGLLNIERAASVILNDNGAHLMQEQTLQQGNTYTIQVVAQGNEPLWVTLCWTDPEGAGTAIVPGNINNRTPKLVNDLDLRVNANQATTLPWVLDPGQPGQPARQGDNIRDNVEQVFIPNPIAGVTYTVVVQHKGQLRYNAQPFSLIVTGQRRKSCQLSVKLLPERDTSVCIGKSITLSTEQPRVAASGALASGLTYEWLRNGNVLAKTELPAYSVSQSGTYLLRITDRNGCVGTSRPMLVQQITPTAFLTPAEDQWLCQARPTIRLAATAEAGTKYEWLKDGQVMSAPSIAYFDATKAGRYQVRVTQHGCQYTTPGVTLQLASSLLIDVQPADADIALPRGASVRLQTPVNKTCQYQWLRDEQLLPSATTERLLVNEPGQYRVRVSQQECAVLSTVRTVRWADGSSLATLPDSLFLFELADSTLLLYPNPATTSIYIRHVRPVAVQMYATVFDILGRVRLNQTLMANKGTFFDLTIDVSDLPKGHYFVRVSDGYRPKTARFIKR